MINQQELINKVKSYNKFYNKNTIEKAYTFALNAHKNQKRDAGEPYIIHPVAVADIQDIVRAVGKAGSGPLLCWRGRGR